MSQTSNDPPISPTKKFIIRHRKDTGEIVAKLNKQLDDLSQRILNPQPFLLSVPTDVPYRHSSRAINNWRQGTAFEEDECQLQYMSFLPHQDEEEDLLYVEGGWSDAKGESEVIERSPLPGLLSGQQTPHETRRKKISLKDYKTKDKSVAEDSEKPKEAAADETVSNENRPISRSIDTIMEDQRQAPKPASKDERRPSGSHMDGAGSSPIRQSQDELDSERPRKRQRTKSPELEINDEDMSTSIDVATKPAVAKPASRLPGLTSPTLPASTKSKALPPLLSSSLPKPIKDYLASTNGANGKDVNGDQRRSEPVRSILASAGLGTSSHMRSDSQNSVQNALSAPSPHARGISPGSINGVRTPQRHGTPVLNGIRASPGPRQRHIIVLKYGKKNRKRIDALLRFAPRTKHIDPQQKIAVKSPEVSTKIVKPHESSPATIKRSHEVTSDPSFKKQRPHAESTSSTEKSSTPSYTSNHNGHKSKPSITKSDFTTPDKSLKSAAMARIASTDAIEAHTPLGDRARLSTPTSLDRHPPPSKPSPQPTSAHNSKDPERTTWHALGEKHFALGRKVKSEATSISSDSSSSRSEAARSVVLLVEGLLCFMINLAAESHSRASSPSTPGDPGWHTILPYHIFVFRASRKFPHLHGLVTQLGAVCRQHLHRFDLEKLMKEPLPAADDHGLTASAPTPGSDGTTKNTSLEDAERSRKKYIDFRDQLVLNAKELATAWIDGGRELSLEMIENSYPKTWAGRAKDWSRRGGGGSGRHDPGKIPKEYYLPLDATATVFEAVGFALAVLEEWAGREKVEWKTRIEI